MSFIDRALGPLNPSRMAAKTAAPPKSVLVVNATEEQCSSVCQALIKDGHWIIYGLVEDVTHPVAQKLAGMQVKIIRGDLSDPSSYVDRLKDMDGVFVHVEFDAFVMKWDDDIKEAVDQEIKLTTALVDACVKAQVKHLVYSTLDDLPDSEYVPHCHAKAQVAKYIKTTNLPTTFLFTSTPFSIIVNRHLLKRQEDGTFLLNMRMPDDFVFPGYPTEQTGDWVKLALNKPDKWTGKDMHACTEHISPASMAHDLSKIVKKPVNTNHVSRDTFHSPEHREKLGETTWTHYKAILEGMVHRDEAQSETAVPHQWRFKQWAAWSPDVQAILKGES
ncbi:hypothetical protein BD324DRAFT_622315 [Kockovaella imperatae]|uniref:NmrA-like domain-containing protein n=1 Tax=Kockovaella imperatae TaxID=4999 RepID=A0A1Y1UHN7_9TREE|nr:hypothetical protein BD324DRAFT_622315 [Kockovaella imperatae]ORX37542.1 hypothetical protein BD324DRAFT_622315 [Kockovaella imperatae]